MQLRTQLVRQHGGSVVRQFPMDTAHRLAWIEEVKPLAPPASAARQLQGNNYNVAGRAAAERFRTFPPRNALTALGTTASNADVDADLAARDTGGLAGWWAADDVIGTLSSVIGIESEELARALALHFGSLLNYLLLRNSHRYAPVTPSPQDFGIVETDTRASPLPLLPPLPSTGTRKSPRSFVGRACRPTWPAQSRLRNSSASLGRCWTRPANSGMERRRACSWTHWMCGPYRASTCALPWSTASSATLCVITRGAPSEVVAAQADGSHGASAWRLFIAGDADAHRGTCIYARPP